MASSRPLRSDLEKALVGPAGEHYVLYRLYREGMLASLAPPGAPTIDVLILAPDESVVATMQVKTRTYGADGGWHMSTKHEHIVAPRCFYAFVDLELDPPVTFVVPSAIVAKVLPLAHQVWLTTPGRGGRPHNDHSMRRILPDYTFPVPGYPPGWLNKYRERWDLLTALAASPASGGAVRGATTKTPKGPRAKAAPTGAAKGVKAGLSKGPPPVA